MFISKRRYNDLLVRLEKCEFDMKYIIECKVRRLTDDEEALCARLTKLERYAKNKKAAEKTALESLPNIEVGRYGV